MSIGKEKRQERLPASGLVHGVDDCFTVNRTVYGGLMLRLNKHNSG